MVNGAITAVSGTITAVNGTVTAIKLFSVIFKSFLNNSSLNATTFYEHTQ